MKRILSLSLAIAFAYPVNAQINVAKDLSFGNNGTVTISTGLSPNVGNILLIPNIHSTFQNSKIFVSYPYADPANFTSKTQFVRLNADGSLDSTFGINGSFQIPYFEAFYFYANENFIYLNQDKKYFSNGQQDTNFASSGILQNSLWNYKIGLPDGKIFIRGDDFFGRFLTDGNPDQTYGTNGNISINSAVAGNSNSSYAFFFQKDNFIYEFIYPSTGQSNIRKININTGNLDLSYGVNGYAQVKNSSIPSANYSTSVVSMQLDGSFINKLSDGNTVFFTKTDVSGNLDPNFGINGVVSANLTFTDNGNTYSASGMDPLVYNNMIIMPAEYTDAQGTTKWGISCYSFTGNTVSINGAVFYPLSGVFYDLLGYLFAKDNDLYAIHDDNITRYNILQQTVLSADHAETNNQSIIFDNPFDNELFVRSSENIKCVEIMDQSGRVLLKGANRINTSTLVKGTYIIRISTASGRVVSKKGIKS